MRSIKALGFLVVSAALLNACGDENPAPIAPIPDQRSSAPVLQPELVQEGDNLIINYGRYAGVPVLAGTAHETANPSLTSERSRATHLCMAAGYYQADDFRLEPLAAGTRTAEVILNQSRNLEIRIDQFTASYSPSAVSTTFASVKCSRASRLGPTPTLLGVSRLEDFIDRVNGAVRIDPTQLAGTPVIALTGEERRMSGMHRLRRRMDNESTRADAVCRAAGFAHAAAVSVVTQYGGVNAAELHFRGPGIMSAEVRWFGQVAEFHPKTFDLIKCQGR